MKKLKRTRIAITSLVAATLLMFPGFGVPAQANSLTSVTGSFQTVDGTPVGNLKVSFSQSANGRPMLGSVLADREGRFATNLFEGVWWLWISATKDTPCLVSEFKIQVGPTPVNLNVALPRLKTLKIKYVDDFGVLLPGIETRLQRLEYASVPNPTLGNPVFRCNEGGLRGVPKSGVYLGEVVQLDGFELASDSYLETVKDKRSFTYVDASGSRTEVQLPSDGWFSEYVTVRLNDVPRIRLQKSGVKLAGNTLKVNATFEEAPSQLGFRPKRSVSILIRKYTSNGWSAWIRGASQVVSKSNTLSYPLNVKQHRGQRIQIAFHLAGSSAASDSISTLIPK